MEKYNELLFLYLFSLAQVLILREMAATAPTVFYQQIQQFFDNIFVAVYDSKVRIYFTTMMMHGVMSKIVRQRFKES